MSRSRRILSLALVASLLSVSLAGCGQPATTLVDVPGAGQSRVAAVQTGSAIAQDFARQMRASGFQATVHGAVVTVTGEDGAVQYDFTNTPQTRQVIFRADGVVSAIDYQSDERVLGTRLVMIAVKMAWGGAKAWYWYTKSHQGGSYNREEHVKAVVYGMIKGGLSGLPFGFLWSRLTPIVWKLVTGEAPIAPTLKDWFELIKRELGAVAEVVQEAERLQRLGLSQ